GFSPADTNIKDSFDIAKEQGLEFEFYALDLKSAHPNTTKITLYDEENNRISVMVSSIGGGVIEVNEINDNKVSFSANYATTVIFNHDKAGVVANVTSVLADYKINIAFMKLFRDTDGGNAIMVIESDELVKNDVIEELGKIVNVTKVIYIDPFSM
ncbi:MAG: ACT domain-containing protein, partial [Oscillospiraceae bacterium]